MTSATEIEIPLEPEIWLNYYINCQCVTTRQKLVLFYKLFCAINTISIYYLQV